MSADWYYRSGGREVGPLSWHDMTVIAGHGRLSGETEVRRGANGAWISAGRVPGLIAGGGGGGRAFRSPPPLPTSVDSLFNSIERSRAGSSGRETGAGSTTSFTAGLICFAAVGIVAILVIVVVLATGGGGSRRSLTIASENVQAETASKDAREQPFVASPRRSASPAAGNWRQKIGLKSQKGVVVVINFEGKSQGTGFVIASDGNHKLLLTNKHVLKVGDGPELDPLARQCHLRSPTGTLMQATLAGEASDPSVDLALLLVDSHELRPLGPIKSFADIEVGENVVAVGNPGIPDVPGLRGAPGIDSSNEGTLEETMTQGIVSAKRKDRMIQTDAAINHGNSGGPLVNESGQILGVNTLSYAAIGMQGTNFSIRADWALDSTKWQFYQNVDRLMAAVQRP